ncbi:MAG: winged helix-turn-helix transcriptional regulator [Streptosporangiaceae bacterium]|nr:winged helix-turn-helix transcriptional regulator [Streptosporangiaceae bacterium]
MPTAPRQVRRAHVDLGRVASAIPAAGLVLDSESREVLIHGQRADMTFREFELLHFLVSNPRRVFTREQLLSSVWGYSSEGITRTVDVHIHRLRRKLGPEYGQFLITVSRVGYRFAPPQ